MYRVLFILFIFYVYAWSYPTIFAQMGTPLYKSSKHISNFKDIKELKKISLEYEQMAKATLEQGVLAQASEDDKEKKRYLFQLRKLQKKHDAFVHLLHKKIDEAIKKKDYKLFYRCLEYEFEGLLNSRTLLKRSIAFYQKNKKTNKFLEEKIEFKKLVVYNQNELVVDVQHSTYSPSSKANTRKKVYISVKKHKDYISIFFYNKNPFNITMRIKGEYNNLKHTNLKNTIVLPANSKKRYAKLYKKRAKGSYRLSYSWIMGSMNAVHDDSYIYRLPYARGTSNIVSQGYNGKATHKGNSKYAVDFAMKIGTKIYASRQGVVAKTKDDSNKVGYAPKYAKYGNFVTIEHDDGTFATYYHLKKNGVRVSVGQKVQKGDLLGYSGNTGYSSGPHLHFQVYRVADATSITSIPVKFKSQRGIITDPKKGTYYKAK